MPASQCLNGIWGFEGRKLTYPEGPQKVGEHPNEIPERLRGLEYVDILSCGWLLLFVCRGSLEIGERIKDRQVC